MSTDMIVVYIGVGLYFAAMLAVGYVVKSKIKSAEAYLVAGRSFSLLQNAPALTACFLGGSLVLSLPGLVYGMGVWNDGAMWGGAISLGGCICLLLSGFFYMPKLWRLKLLSLGDFFYLRFGKTTGFIVSIITVLTFVFWVAVQILVFAKICTVFLNWPLVTSAIVGTIIITTYTTMGGLWAVMATDAIQVLLVSLGVVILFPVALGMIGGWDVLVTSIPADRTQVIPAMDAGGEVWLAWLACWAIIGIGGIVSPDLMQRAFAAKTPAVARNSALVACVVKIVLSIIMIGIAFVGYIMVQDGIIAEESLHGDMELIVPVMVRDFLPLPIMIIFVGACLSAVMGAASSAMLALSGMMSKNIIKDVIKPDITDKQLLFSSRICVVTFAVMSLGAALSLKYVNLLLAFGFDLIMSSLLACMTLGMFWKKANSYGAIAGIIAGALVRIIPSGIANGFTLEGICSSAPGWYIYTLLGPVVAFIVTWIVSLATQKQCPSNEYGFHFDENDTPIVKEV
ncbi:MAG: hypothetical protein IJD04_06370 [Desulfovibrionaceae bacterium]|nr:hypothetical protein [Desulfovibrionaceae bacterium]